MKSAALNYVSPTRSQIKGLRGQRLQTHNGLIFMFFLLNINKTRFKEVGTKIEISRTKQGSTYLITKKRRKT